MQSKSNAHWSDLSDSNAKSRYEFWVYDTKCESWESGPVSIDNILAKYDDSTGPSPWISVNNSFPEDKEICLVCGAKGGMRVARFYLRGSKPEWIVVGTGKTFNVTRWMPLPRKPEG